MKTSSMKAIKNLEVRRSMVARERQEGRWKEEKEGVRVGVLGGLS